MNRFAFPHEESEEVPVSTLDELLDGRAAWVKMDAEGAEYDILRGATRSLQSDG